LDAALTDTSTDYKSGVLDVAIYAASVNTGSGRKDGKLKSKDFFNVKHDPLPLVMLTPHLWRAKRTGRSE
jgi:polyisoprenoid-binding protein YceI